MWNKHKNMENFLNGKTVVCQNLKELSYLLTLFGYNTTDCEMYECLCKLDSSEAKKFVNKDNSNIYPLFICGFHSDSQFRFFLKSEVWEIKNNVGVISVEEIVKESFKKNKVKRSFNTKNILYIDGSGFSYTIKLFLVNGSVVLVHCKTKEKYDKFFEDFSKLETITW